MKSKLLFTFLVALAMASNSCSVYTPNALNVPMLKEKGDVSVALHTDISGEIGNLQAAYGVSNNLGVMINYMGLNKKSTEIQIVRNGKGRLFEFGIGYFSPKETKFKTEIYGGGGFGKIDITRTYLSEKTFKASATKFFLQPSIGLVGKYFEVAYSTRLSMVKYSDVSTTYSSDELVSDKFVNIEGPLWLFIEPAITIRGGFEKIKFQLQLGNAFKTNKQILGFDNFIVNFGLIGRL